MVAPNGARRMKTDHPALPIDIGELAATAASCQKAGAKGIHLHVRGQDGLHSIDPGLYREAIRAVDTAAPGLFIQVTSEAGDRFAPDEQVRMIMALCPSSVSVALRELVPDAADTTAARAFYHEACEQGIGVQHIVYSPTELRWLFECVEDGTIPRGPLQLQVVLGNYGSFSAPDPAMLAQYVELIKAHSSRTLIDWMACAFGPGETDCLVAAAAAGSKVRVGFENSLWNRDGGLARDNAERVAEVRRALNVAGLLTDCQGAASPRQTLSASER
ncbi:MAG: 3-keto-5-aminohexanoate cleavage protein [Pseudomonadota bacterium]